LKKIVLAYSGGLDTTVSIKWLQEKYNAEVITATVELGQKEDLDEIASNAKKIGVLKHYSIDAKDEFVTDYVFPCIKANGFYEKKYPLSTALARPLIASKLVEIANKENAFGVAHGCTGKGNDQVRFDVTVKALNPKLKVIAPVREWNLSRDDELKFAKEKGLPVKEKTSVFSTDQNIWGRSIESGSLEDPNNEPPEDAFKWVNSIEKTPDKPDYLELEFEEGIPISINGEGMRGTEIISHVNEIAGNHGIGILDHMEDRLVGIKSREVYECPAAVSIMEAHYDLEKLVLTRHELEFKANVEAQWVWLIYSGLWVDPLRDALEAFIDVTQRKVKGKVKLKMFKGGLRVVSRSSSNSLYDTELATYMSESTFDQRAAEGFISIWGLASEIAKKKQLGN
jgi:argininosuccinate synthase